ncbi:MAG TPA: hypothetical protein VHX52_07465 [Steroidobacteraceae bacterium]|jgi:hypothetical protein|nr:hypothetical protein [Steroidobacteraceae bacterium]
MMRLATADRAAVTRLLAGYGLTPQLLADGESIPGSYWGESEAGLRGKLLFARLDTPLHSVLHETAHYVCMSAQRRARLDRDAGGDDAEESAVCYLQVLMADVLPGVDRERLFADMDRWGYSFRLGTAAAWFGQDADDARLWLQRHGIIDEAGRLTGRVRD